MKNNDIIDLLRSYIINYPVLKDWRKIDPICITLAFNNNTDSMKFLKNLSGSPVVISESDGVPSMKKTVMRRTPQSVFLKLPRCETEKEIGKFSMLLDLLNGEMIADKRFCCPTFVLFIGIVPDIIRRDTLVINLSSDEVIQENITEFFSLVPDPEQLGQVRQKLIDLGDLSEERHPLISAAVFLYPKLHERGEDARFEEILALAKLIADGGMETPPIEDILMLVTERFMEMAENGCMENIVELPNLKDSDIKALDTAFFHDGEFLYISDCHFRTMCRSITEIISYRSVKAALWEGKILKGSGKKYVSKMYYWLSYGVMGSASMLKFDMNLLVKGDVKLNFYFQ